jgi:PD-(D/E)XK endonuclease
LGLSTDQKGAIAESAIVLAAAKLGIGVYLPFSDGERYDLIFDLGRSLVRIQCKWAPLQGDVVVVRAYSSRRTANGLRRRGYEADEIDAIAAYCPELDRCYYLPAGRVVGRIRFSFESRRAATTTRGA